MIDVLCLIATNPAINDRFRVHSEQEHVGIGAIFIFITPIGFFMRDALAEVLDNTGGSLDLPGGESSQAVD